MNWSSPRAGREPRIGAALEKGTNSLAEAGWFGEDRAQIGGMAGVSLAKSMRKPATLVYGVEEAPPPMVTVVSAVQHVGVIAIFMVYPLIIGRQAGAPAEELSNILRMAMLVLACAVLLQALPRGPVGSKLLAPSIFTGVYLGPSMLAVKLGGMPR